MITGLSGASIWSEDHKNLLPFYRDVLGLPLTVDSPGFVVLGEDPRDYGNLWIATLKDPEGNLVQLFERHA